MLHAGVQHDALLRFLSPYEYQDVSQAYFHGVGLANSGWGRVITLNAGKRQFKIESALIPGKREIPDSPPLAFDHGTLKQRYAEWHAAASMMNQHPVLGVGPGGYQQTIGEYYSPMPKLNTAEPGTQNGWLVLGSSIGVIGMLALMAALLWGAASLLPWFKVASPTGPASDARQLAPGIACLGLLLGGFWTPLFQTGTLVPIAVLLALTDSCLNPQWPSGDRIPLGLKKCLHGLSLLLPLAALGFTLAAVGSRPKTSDSVYLWQAAKQAQEIRQPMALKADPDASGGAALVLPKGVGKGWRNEAGGQAVFSFNLKESDRYNFWARTLWTDGCCNSLYTSFNDGRRLILGEDAEFGKWHWVRLTGLRLSQGRLRVTVSNREDGIAIDKFLLTNDETFQPQGQWEQVFTRDLSQPALTGWTPLGAAPWVIHKDKEMAGRYLPPGAGSAQALVLLDSALDSDFELECRFVLTDAAGGLRIPFLYQDPKNYHYLDLARTRASLGRLHDGRAEILEQTTGTQLIELNHPVRASLRLRSGAITVQCDGRNLMERIDRRQVAGRCGFGAPQGGVIVSSFDLRPLEGIYFLEDFTATSNGSAQRGGGMTIGRPDWGNYAVTLTAQGALTQPVVRLNVNESEQSWLEVALGQTECKISSVRKGGVAAAYSAARPKPAGAPAQASSSTLCIRSIDHDLTVLVDGHEIGRWALPAESSAKGAVQIANADGITRLEVKGLRRFYDGFGGCDGNNSASWPPHGGKWKVLTDPVAGLEDCFAQLGGGKAMALTGESYWEQYELGCMVRSAGENGIGLVLHYIDDANYDLIRWAAASSSLPYAGKLQWVRRREGRESVAGSADLSYDGDRWYEMRVSPSLGRDRLFIDGREVLAVPARDGERGAIGLFSEENPGTFFDNVRVDFF